MKCMTEPVMVVLLSPSHPSSIPTSSTYSSCYSLLFVLLPLNFSTAGNLPLYPGCVCRSQEYYQECEMFGLVTKMLIEKDPSLEHSIQASLQKNLRDIGKRCVEAMEKFIQDYDSQEHSD